MPSPEGGHVLQVPRAGVEGTVACTLLSWVDGEIRTGSKTEELAQGLGKLLATLHHHAESWERPPGFVRPMLDRTWTRTALARIGGLVSEGVVSATDHELVSRAVDRLEVELGNPTDPPGGAGLIHADLHEGNYVVHEGQPRPIDFSRAGFGPWLYDVAECAAALGPARRRDLVETYGAERPLDEGDLRRIEGYFVAAFTECCGYHAPDPTEREWLKRAVPSLAGFARRYLEGRSFLFEV